MSEPVPPECLVRVIREPDDEGRGAFINLKFSAYIITAAHCLPKLPSARDPIGEPLLVDVASLRPGGLETKLLVVFADPCSDLAILGDSTRGWELCDVDCHAAESWTKLQEKALTGDNAGKPSAEKTTEQPLVSAHINLDEVAENDSIPVRVFSCDGEWIQGAATVTPDDPMMTVNFERAVPVGTSGAPIFHENGTVVGVVSTQIESAIPDGGRALSSLAVLLRAALPGWFTEALYRRADLDRNVESTGRS